jgi:hypothetical protein
MAFSIGTHYDTIYILVFSCLEDKSRANLLQNIKQGDYIKVKIV